MVFPWFSPRFPLLKPKADTARSSWRRASDAHLFGGPGGAGGEGGRGGEAGEAGEVGGEMLGEVGQKDAKGQVAAAGSIFHYFSFKQLWVSWVAFFDP